MYLSFYKGHETPGISSIDLLALCSGVFFVVSNYLIMSELNESEKKLFYRRSSTKTKSSRKIDA